jgi:hypothetical protein
MMSDIGNSLKDALCASVANTAACWLFPPKVGVRKTDAATAQILIQGQKK